ncbi:MAG TPA: LuxR C-terminal-related transcriptional regulator [Chryseosolibacter sp.]|nr:LuxR C-terminal-related transcriptional regulator [Chryseosolibacter sp.]
MKLTIRARELEILRKTVYGLSPKEIAAELQITAEEVERSLKGLMKSTQSKEPMQAMQILAKNGFQLLD